MLLSLNFCNHDFLTKNDDSLYLLTCLFDSYDNIILKQFILTLTFVGCVILEAIIRATIVDGEPLIGTLFAT